MNYKKIIIEHDNSKIIEVESLNELEIMCVDHENILTIEYDPNSINHHDLLMKIVNLKINIIDIKIEENNLEEVFINLINK